MKAFTFTSLSATVLAFAMAASPASAQDATADPVAPGATSPAVVVTPFVSMDSRGSTPIGVAVSFPLSSSFCLETEVGYHKGEGRLNALSSSANLLYALPRLGRTTPYLATGAGLAQYGAPIVSREGSLIGTEPRVAFEVNAGGGLEVPVSDTWGMRTDARWFKSFGRNASEHWRVSHGVSFDAGTR
jgi:opacity protein-like surface antigen